MPIFIALDIGKKRTGIAKSDSMGIIIKPLKTIDSDNLLEELKALSRQNDIEKLIIGEPVNIENANKEAYEFIQSCKKRIQEEFSSLEIVMVNESFSSKEAQAALKEKGTKLDKNNKVLIDMYAAAIILEHYFAENT